MMRPTDKLVALTVKDLGITHNTTEMEVNRFRADAGHTGPFEVMIFDKPATVPVYQVIKDYLKN